MSGEREHARRVIEQLLQDGEVITMDTVQAAMDLTVPRESANRSWRNGYVRRLVHRVAGRLGFVAISVGRGQGFKAVLTDDDSRQAWEKAKRQIEGQGGRLRRLKEQQRGLALNQLRFDFGEGMADADAADRKAHGESI